MALLAEALRCSLCGQPTALHHPQPRANGTSGSDHMHTPPRRGPLLPLRLLVTFTLT